MSSRYLGGVISATPPTMSSSVASGSWTLQAQMQARAAGNWPFLTYLWTWGYNAYGQLGLGDTTNRSSPTQVGALTTWLKIAGGREHTIAIG